MISILDNNVFNEQKNTLRITYPRTVDIVFGMYPFPDKINNFIIDTKNNLVSELEAKTHVKGRMTDWRFFTKNKNFNEFINYIINQNQSTSPELFKYFYQKKYIPEAWGVELKPNEVVTSHTHTTWNGILYLTKGSDLLLPELNLRITPEPGAYYILPPQIVHGVDKSNSDNNRYSLIFNVFQKDEAWELHNELY